PGDDEARLPLPLRRVRSGVTAEDDEEDADGDETPVEDSDLQRAPASLRLGDLRRGLVAASRTLELATRLDSRMPLADHLERLDCLVAEGLLWGPDDPARVEL